MTLERTLKTVGFDLSQAETDRIERQLDALDRRLVNHVDPKANLVLTSHQGPRQIEADLRIQMSPLGQHLISHQTAETPDRAVHLAVKDVERQLERRHAVQRGEPTYGVPSRRLPAELRPANATLSEEPAELAD